MRSSGSESMEALAAALDALDAQDLAGVSDAGLSTQLRGLWVLLCRMQAQLSRRIAVFDERGAAGRDGARSIRHWLRHRLRIDGSEAARQAVVASALAVRPAVAAAYRRGELSLDHVAALDDAGWLLGLVAMERGTERVLLARARREPPGRVRRLARRLREQLDPVTALRAYRQLRQERWFDAVRTASGAVAVRGQLDPGDGELMLAALAAQRPVPDDSADRTPSQRRADALASVCRTALRADVFFTSDRPQLTVTVPLATLVAGSAPPDRQPGQADLAVDADPAVDAVGGRRAAEFGSGEPMPAETARRLACDARVIPAVLGGAGEPLDIGAEAPTVPQGLRRALELRDVSCRFPGCDRLGTDCAAHHLRHWASGGSSTMDNLVLLCPYHHVLVHEGGWRLHRDALSGDLRVYRPDGSRLEP
jgi:hypothetical protein